MHVKASIYSLLTLVQMLMNKKPEQKLRRRNTRT